EQLSAQGVRGCLSQLLQLVMRSPLSLGLTCFLHTEIQTEVAEFVQSLLGCEEHAKCFKKE
ncbi:hypothetical protein STEG23_002540, partial [Scotinomys teguina]